MTQQSRAFLAALNIFFNVLALLLVILLGFKFGWTAFGMAIMIAMFKLHAYRCYATAKFAIKGL